MIDYDGRRFRKPGDASGTVATYHQQGDVIWADFSGGEVRRGSITGIRQSDGTLHLGYTMVLNNGEVICGRSLNTPITSGDGPLRLRETWERYGPHAGTGVSYLEEVG
ncbi:hypothetical protein ACTOB_007068 [Actinoplanes oblitus]|uniref:N-acetylglutamate synthase n=1 Tax=Actinoplanes oblitus TaxID=3040509 RepID=A0ABY8WDK1_9ACTN|nr:hypothetical protein [Actinoplanes oblitus]WIM95007.1 hypothetical protein ACTOB_007068 [Actinoplanes oblitus]